MWKNRRLKMSCWKNENNLEKRINKFMEYSIKFDFVTATEKDIKEHKWEKYKLNIKQEQEKYGN